MIRARISATGALPHLVGSGPAVAQYYWDHTLSYATYMIWQPMALLLLVWVLGVIGELFVPALPPNISRREFGVVLLRSRGSVMFHAQGLTGIDIQELRFEAADDLNKCMSLDELEEKLSDKRIGFVDLDFPDHQSTSEPSDPSVKPGGRV